jgi:hypothetical protein
MTGPNVKHVTRPSVEHIKTSVEHIKTSVEHIKARLSNLTISRHVSPQELQFPLTHEGKGPSQPRAQNPWTLSDHGTSKPVSGSDARFQLTPRFCGIIATRRL